VGFERSREKGKAESRNGQEETANGDEGKY
jgi:hypothetical protein